MGHYNVYVPSVDEMSAGAMMRAMRHYNAYPEPRFMRYYNTYIAPMHWQPRCVIMARATRGIIT